MARAWPWYGAACLHERDMRGQQEVGACEGTGPQQQSTSNPLKGPGFAVRGGVVPCKLTRPRSVGGRTGGVRHADPRPSPDNYLANWLTSRRGTCVFDYEEAAKCLGCTPRLVRKLVESASSPR